MSTTVTLSSKYQIVIPQAAEKRCSLSAGDELLVLCKSDRVVIIPKPKKFAKRTRGLHSDVWQGAEAYLQVGARGLVAGLIAPRHQRILLDTSVWIYHFEQNATFGEAAGYVIEQLEAGRFQGVASELHATRIDRQAAAVGSTGCSR